MSESTGFVVELDGFEGPIDLLLNLAREQKVDLAKISILALAEQYLAYIQRARDLKLELAADYLVMAAWLAYLKSRLLLPEAPGDDEPSGAELAEALASRLRRLAAIRRAVDELMTRPRLGFQRFARGCPEGLAVRHKSRYRLALHELLEAYVDQRMRRTAPHLTMVAAPVFRVEDALERAGVAEHARVGTPAVRATLLVDAHQATTTRADDRTAALALEHALLSRPRRRRGSPSPLRWRSLRRRARAARSPSRRRPTRPATARSG